MSAIELGLVYEPYPEELAELSDALAVLGEAPPAKAQIGSFAGPNEVVQLLLDQATWQNALSGLALLFGGKFAASFATELGKLTAAEVWKEKANYYEAIKQKTSAPFLRIVSAIQALRSKGQTITVAVRISNASRNAGLEITSDDAAEIAWQIANIARSTEEIQQIIAKNWDFNRYPAPGETNSDLSIPIEVLESGDVRVLGIVIKK